MEQRVMIMLGLIVIALLPAGCGVLSLPAEVTDALEEWRDRAGETDPCRFDAMQHCVGASAAGAACGEPCAIQLGRLLELVQGDGNAMDLHNNAAGASCAAPLGDETNNAVDCCEELLNADPSALETDGPCE